MPVRPVTAARRRRRTLAAALLLTMAAAATAPAVGEPDHRTGALDTIRARGELRHLGVRYANFVTGPGEGLDADVVRLFAERLGVQYVFVESDWPRIIPDLLGHGLVHDGDRVRPGDPQPRRGDLIATGLTVLPWREQVVAFSRPTFPTQIWLIAPADSPLQPIAPSRDLARDIEATRSMLDRLSVLAKDNTCLAPDLYDLEATGAEVVPFADQLKFMAPAVLSGQAATTILDVPDALVALRLYPQRLKVLGPISPPQQMAAAFAPADRDLREAYDVFLAEIMADGTYDDLIDRYYPAVRQFFPDFFGAARHHP